MKLINIILFFIAAQIIITMVFCFFLGNIFEKVYQLEDCVFNNKGCYNKEATNG